MKIEINLIDNELNHKCQWDDDDIFHHIKSFDDISNIFDVSISIGEYSFSGFCHSARDVLLDIMINHRIFSRGGSHSFFISDTPLFLIKNSSEGATISFAESAEKRISHWEYSGEIDRELQLVTCRGIYIASRLPDGNLGNIFQTVQDDLNSKNRADFIGS